MDLTRDQYLRPCQSANRPHTPQVTQFADMTHSNQCVIKEHYDRYYQSQSLSSSVASHKLADLHKIYCTMLILLTQSICHHIDPAYGSHLNHTASDHNKPLSLGQSSSLGSTIVLIRNSTHHQHPHHHHLHPHLHLHLHLHLQQQQQINHHHGSHHRTNHDHDLINSRRQYRRSSSIDVSKNDSNLVNDSITSRLHQPNSLLTPKQMVHAVLNHTHHHHHLHHHINQSQTDYTGNNTDYSESERELSNVRKNSLNGTPPFLDEEEYFKEEAEFQEYFMQFVIVADCFIFLIGLCGNLVVITVILRFTRNENVNDIYILNLAFADLAFIMGLFFMIITIYLEEFIFGNLICKVYMSITSINQYASSLLLVIMSYDRFIAVCHPIYAQQFRNPRRAKIICMMIWIASLTLMQPVFLYSKIAIQNYGPAKSEKSENPDSEQYEDTGCRISWPESETIEYATLFTLYSFAIGFAIPLSLIACFYACVIRKLRMSAFEPITKSRSSRRTRARESTNKRIEHLVIAIILTYTICWLPYWIVQVYMSSIDLTKNEKFPFSVFPFIQTATTLSYTNSALNPILYAFLSDNFKRRFSDIIRSFYSIKWCRQEIGTESNSTVMSALT